MRGRCNLIPTLSDNCTCVTSKGTYSLFPLRRTDGQPKFPISGVPPHKGYTYTYNPCVPYNFTSSHGSCINVALCKYDTGGDPPDYSNIGEQKEVQCEISLDGKIALVYPVHKYNPKVPGLVSKVTLECNKDSKADPVFTLTNEDDMTFNLKSHCGCIDGCPPGPEPTIPVSTGSTTPSTKSGPSSTERPVTPSNGTETPSSGPGDLNSYWELKILLPSLLGAFFVVVIFFVCLWRRLCIVQMALLCRCCHCHEQIKDPLRETSALISNEEYNRAVEHDFLGAKDKLKEPVQVEDGNLKAEYKFPAEKDDITVVV